MAVRQLCSRTARDIRHEHAASSYDPNCDYRGRFCVANHAGHANANQASNPDLTADHHTDQHRRANRSPLNLYSNATPGSLGSERDLGGDRVSYPRLTIVSK